MPVIPRPWRLFLVVLLATMAVIAFFEQDRRARSAAIVHLDEQVGVASKQVNALRAREQKLAEGEVERAALESRLLDPERGSYYRQLLDVVVAAGRRANVGLERLTFTPTQPIGPVEATMVSGVVTGSEAHILLFLRELEEGQPIGQLDKIGWSAQITNRADPTLTDGQVSFEVTLYGPFGTGTSN